MKKLFEINLRGNIVPVVEKSSISGDGEYTPWDKTIAIKRERDASTIIHEILHASIDLYCKNIFKDDAQEEEFVDFFEHVISDFFKHNAKVVSYIINCFGDRYGKPARRHPGFKKRKQGRPQRNTGRSLQKLE